MRRNSAFFVIFLFLLVAMPHRSPAPLIYTPGIGWTYESVSRKGNWHRGRAKEQMDIAREAMEEKDFKLARKSAHRTLKNWPLSDYAAEAQFIKGLAYEELNRPEKAFNEYQKIIDNYPKFENYDNVLERQYEIAGKFLDGRWFRLWGYIPVFPSMQKTADMYKKLIENGPYTDVGAQASLKVGEANEKQKNFHAAVQALTKAADRYHDRKNVASEALFRAGLAYQKQAKTAEYDQDAAVQAINTFTDFIALYPEDERVDEAREIIESLRTEQARGAYKIARYYEKQKSWKAGLVYYNEVLILDPNSSYGDEAKERIEMIKMILKEVEAVKAEYGLTEDL